MATFETKACNTCKKHMPLVWFHGKHPRCINCERAALWQKRNAPPRAA